MKTQIILTLKHHKWQLVLTIVAAIALAADLTIAKPPGGGGGGGKGGGGGGGAATHTVTDLGGGGFGALGINNPDNGFVQAVGDSGDGGALLWDVDLNNGAVTESDLGNLGIFLPPDEDMNAALAKAIGDTGLIIGNSSMVVPAGGWSWQPTTMTPLPTGNYEITEPLGLNIFDDIVGRTETHPPGGPNLVSGALWISNNGTYLAPIDLGNFIPLDINDLLDINDNPNPVMAGYVYDEGMGTRVAATATVDGSGILKQELGFLSPDHVGSVATAINNQGEVVGYSAESTGPGTIAKHAFVWTNLDGVTWAMEDLGDLGGGASDASDINEAGEIVGVANKNGRNNVNQAALWNISNGAITITNLNDAIDDGSWYLIKANGINDAGQIVGVGRVGSGNNTQDHAFLLTPIP